MGRWFVCASYVIGTLLIVRTRAFNLEPRIPMIKEGSPNSYFGYSVSGHQILDHLTGDIREHLILVGAPQGETGQPGTKLTGLVLKCPISARRDDCTTVNVENLIGLGPARDEIKDGQWLGVTVRSQGRGGSVLACAHRYIMSSTDYRYGIGVCYGLTQTLDYNTMYDACRGLQNEKGHEQYGYCQVGVDAYIAEDNTVLLGAPGSYAWMGSAMVNSLQEEITDDNRWYNSPVETEPLPVKAYSYLGYSVTTGFFLGDKMTYVSGAPRSADFGEIVFFHKGEGGNLTLVQVGNIKGENLGSYFGHAVTAVDLNGDSYPDLVVGAPFYRGENNEEGGAIYVYHSTKQGLALSSTPVRITGSKFSQFGFSVANISDVNLDGFEDIAVGAPYENNGTVYIYHGSAEGIIPEPVQVITSDVLPEGPFSTFGHSVAGGLDLDDNGYPDLLVGAYGQDQTFLLWARPVVHLTTEIKGLVKAIDPSKRDCNDGSNRLCFTFTPCFKYSAKPARFNTRLRMKYEIIADSMKVNDFLKRVYFKNVGDPQWKVTREVTLYRQRADRLVCGNEETVYLKSESRDILNPIKFTVTNELVVDTPEMPQPLEPLPSMDDYPILGKESTESEFKVEFLKDCGSDEQCHSDLTVEGSFDLPAVSAPGRPTLVLGEREQLMVTVMIYNRGEPAYETEVTVSFPDFIDSFIFNSGTEVCKSINNSAVCELGNPFKKNGKAELKFDVDTANIPATAKLLNISVVATTSSKEINPKDNVLHLEAKVIIRAEILIEGSTYPKDQVLFGGDVVGAFAMKQEEQIGSLVAHNYVIVNNGTGRIDKLQVVVSWPYEVENNKEHGKYLLYMLEVPEIAGPGECIVDKAYVNPLNVRINPKSHAVLATTISPATELTHARLRLKEPKEDNQSVEDLNNLDDHNKGESAMRKRRKREAFASEIIDKKSSDKVVTMDCQLGTAKCFTFVCNIGELGFRESAKITIRARLWNSTFIQDYSWVDYVKIISRANVTIDPSLNVEQNTSNDYALAVTKAYPDALRVEIEQAFPLWIIIVSIVAGVLLLLVIILILCWAGFFKRTRPEEMTATMEKKKLYGDEL